MIPPGQNNLSATLLERINGANPSLVFQAKLKNIRLATDVEALIRERARQRKLLAHPRDLVTEERATAASRACVPHRRQARPTSQLSHGPSQLAPSPRLEGPGPLWGDPTVNFGIADGEMLKAVKLSTFSRRRLWSCAAVAGPRRWNLGRFPENPVWLLGCPRNLAASLRLHPLPTSAILFNRGRLLLTKGCRRFTFLLPLHNISSSCFWHLRIILAGASGFVSHLHSHASKAAVLGHGIHIRDTQGAHAYGRRKHGKASYGHLDISV